MKITYKVRVNDYNNQAVSIAIDQGIGDSRKSYNIYIDIAQRMLDNGFKLPSAYTFSKWFNHYWIKKRPQDADWLKQANSKNIKQGFIDAHRTMATILKCGKKKHRYFKPKFRALKHQDGGYYFVRNDKKHPLRATRNALKVPGIGKVPLAEYGYLPYGKKSVYLSSGRIKRKGDHHYLTCVADVPQPVLMGNTAKGIGIDIGIKDMAIKSNNIFYKNLNKTRRMKRLYKHIRKMQKHLSRQFRSYYTRKKALQEREHSKRAFPTTFKLTKNENYLRSLYQRAYNILNDYQNKIVNQVVTAKPAYIAIENLNVQGMVKNHHLARAIEHERFFAFRQKVIFVCKKYNIPVHLVNRYYPSSKRCHACGAIKSDLNLSDRTYICKHCGMIINRDYNAALNLRDTDHYILLDSSNDYTVLKGLKNIA